jgi:hypothetical protein
MLEVQFSKTLPENRSLCDVQMPGRQFTWDGSEIYSALAANHSLELQERNSWTHDSERITEMNHGIIIRNYNFSGSMEAGEDYTELGNEG